MSIHANIEIQRQALSLLLSSNLSYIDDMSNSFIALRAIMILDVALAIQEMVNDQEDYTSTSDGIKNPQPKDYIIEALEDTYGDFFDGRRGGGLTSEDCPQYDGYSKTEFKRVYEHIHRCFE